MALVNMKEVLKGSVENRFAVGGFDTMDYVLTDVIMNAAEETKTPVVMMVPDFVLYKSNAKDLFSYIHHRIECSPIPVALHLDHGDSLELVWRALHFGFSSVMIDGSRLPLEENIRKTYEVVKIAHRLGVSVEAELGHVGGVEGGNLKGGEGEESVFTEPKEAAYFVEKTEIDVLAVAVGTVHGVYRGTPKIDFERISAIRREVDVPLAMHGGSGLPAGQVQRAIDCGINKINYFTGMSLEATKAISEKLEKTEGKIHFFELVEAGQKRAEEILKKQIELYGTPSLS